ncbi:UNVERIFIED_CONTAM: yjdF [Trichonephila clavipes]
MEIPINQINGFEKLLNASFIAPDGLSFVTPVTATKVIAMIAIAPIGMAFPIMAAITPTNIANKCQAFGSTPAGTGTANQIMSITSIAIFSAEYFLRFWSVAENDPTDSAWNQRWKWAKSGGAIIDLIAILPAYFNFFVHIDLRVLRILRLLRLLKLTRYFVSLQILLRVIKREKGSFQAVIFILVIMIVMAASGIYVVENKAQPEAFSSIPKAMWWAVVTLTTVGYGDVTPVTSMGKFLGALITILGVGIAALPAGILASGLANELNQRNQKLEQEFRELLQAQGNDVLHNQLELEKLRQRVGLPKEQMHEIIVQLMREHLLEGQEKKQEKKHYCPYCGLEPYDRITWLMEVIPVLIAIPVLFVSFKKFPLTNLLYSLIFLHAIVLIIGGTYTYARVPLGFEIAEWFNLDRNPYDKIGHFMQGFVPAIVAREILLRNQILTKGKMLAFIVICIVLAISAMYELIEWAAALLMGQGAEEFLGTQGYEWDTQSDMFFALIGGISALLFLSKWHDQQIEKLRGSL